ncbi:MAG: asparagine--tRNA ligase, partial [Bacillales bacterium]|nr:asparagine--tRNA ligase [Bacillales bacterium]
MSAEFKTIRELYEITRGGSKQERDSLDVVQIEGWVRTNRNNGSLGFIEINDGTYFKNAQLVYTTILNNFNEVGKTSTGSAISITGKVVFTPENKQPFEINLETFELIGECESDYPLQKKRHGYEFLREIAHLRPRTNTFSAVFRVRSVLSMAIHEFFQSQGFIYLHAPIITSNDAEGAGECFTVTTRKDDKYEEDFFGKHANLTVTGQLQAEAFALAFRDVYTFGPTFRAENSNTSRHAAEFWMIEPEIAFADLEDDMDLIEDMVKFCINYVLENCPEEMNFFNTWVDKTLLEKLEHVLTSTFAKLDYSKGIELLKEAVNKGHKFDNSKIEWGMDLQSEHERYLCEIISKGPLFLINYPQDIKAFYMRLNDDKKTVAACDLLVPHVGELVGGSQREERYDLLLKRMNDLKIPQESLQWYLDLRRYGGCKH